MSATAYMLPTYGQMDPFISNYQSAYQTGASYVSEEQQSGPRSGTPASAYTAAYTTSPALLSTSLREAQQRAATRHHRTSYTSSYHSNASDSYPPHGSSGQGSFGFSNPSSHLAHFPGSDIASAAYGASYSLSNPSFNTSSFNSHYAAVPNSSPGFVPGQAVSDYSSPHGYAASNSADVTPGTPEDAGVRVLNSRPKPQCWDHGCNGRQFSTFSNLLRHQREKSGTAAKSVCPRCGAEFTRTTARNGHMAHDKCKGRSTTSTSGLD